MSIEIHPATKLLAQLNELRERTAKLALLDIETDIIKSLLEAFDRIENQIIDNAISLDLEEVNKNMERLSCNVLLLETIHIYTPSSCVQRPPAL